VALGYRGSFSWLYMAAGEKVAERGLGKGKARPLRPRLFLAYIQHVRGVREEEWATRSSHSICEAPGGFGPPIRVLQTLALPLGHGAGAHEYT
jgi:hypothetical protein